MSSTSSFIKPHHELVLNLVMPAFSNFTIRYEKPITSLVSFGLKSTQSFMANFYECEY